MYGPLLLAFCLFGFTSGNFFSFVSSLRGGVSDIKTTTSSPSLVVRPHFQTVNEYEDIVIDCFQKDGGEIHWSRPKGLSMPKQARQKNGRLTIERIEYADAGYYTCFSQDNFSATAFVLVNKGDPSGILTTSRGLVPDVRITENPFETTRNPKTTVNVPYPCLYGICNGTCCEANSIQTFFDCANGQKINRSLVCNRVNDCEDGSDESRCTPWPSKITVLPKQNVEVHCGYEGKQKTGILILECQAVGHPTPTIRWKKYDGHVASKCQQFSKRGHGILTCPDFQQSDQGAYSCVAENSVKSAESQPKSLAKCSNTIPCSNGFKVVNEEQIEHCIKCYCSGKTTSCTNMKSIPSEFKIPFPENPVEVFAKDDGEVLFLPTTTQLTPSPKIRNFTQEVTYCSVPESDLQKTSFLKSFGRRIIIMRHKGKATFMEKAPDLIIRGNGLPLMYTASRVSLPKSNVMDVSVKLWPGNWHHLNKTVANRKDLMKVLSNVDSLLIRCEYQGGNILSLNKNASITIESSTIGSFGNSISYVEKCNCPPGYDGLSCESCADGYERKPRGNDFICEKIYVPPPPPVCKTGYIDPNCSVCDLNNGYYRNGDACMKPTCHPLGSTSLFHDVFNKCTCKERVTGDSCDRCENGSFYLHKARGCLKCWCSGVTDQCSSSNFYRTVISNTPRGGYNSSDGRNFWLLPSEFSGNRLTSYGGHLNYTMKYKPRIPKEKTYLTVELLSMDDITLIYTHSTVDNSLLKDEKSWSVPLTEIDWRKSDTVSRGDKNAVSRGEFLTLLSKIKAIYIESPYHLSSGQANLTSARMSSASESGGGENELALAVERCNCPIGYSGLSCEKCSDGYYKKRNGTITQCIKCNCTYCDPDFGCPDCPPLTYRDNPEEEKIPVCKTCPCNGNGVSCVKDDYHQIFCHCKQGFTGMHCENRERRERNDLTITISPRRITGKKVDTAIFVNCSVLSSEEMTLTAMKRFVEGVRNDSEILSTRGSNISQHFEVVLEAGLETVECLVRDTKGRVAGQVVSVIEDLITNTKPVKITNCYSERIYVKESESKEIICQTTGFPTATVTWYKKTNGSESEKVDTSDGVHTIESPSLKDNGTIYTCIAENAIGDKATCAQILIVRKKCEVINIFPRHVRAFEGEDISLLCKTTAKSPVVWTMLDTFFRSEKTIVSTRVEMRDGYLGIKNATVMDSGTYICSAEGENGKINQTVEVAVEERKVPPSVSLSELDRTLKVGENFRVHCTATGKPTPFITWMKLNDTFESNVFAIGKAFEIRKATLKNSGVYGCEARSSSGVASEYISIEVEQDAVPPQVKMSESTIKVLEGEVVTLSCLAIGYPRPNLTWVAPGINFSIQSREIDEMILIEPNESIKQNITFRATKHMNGVIIKCFAENSAGKEEDDGKIVVLQKKIQKNERIELAPIGSYIELRCDLTGELKWEKVGGHLVGDECFIPNALMIPSAQIQHNGTYLCKDDSGSTETINLKVVGFVPRFSTASNSYLVVRSQMESFGEARIEMSFKSTDGSGVLLQEENKLDIYLQKRLIHLNIGFDKGPFFNVDMKRPIEIGSWYSLVVTINRYVNVTIYSESSQIHENKAERCGDFVEGVDFGEDNLYVGGPKPGHCRPTLFGNPHRKHLNCIASTGHFDGCISRLFVNGHEFDIVNEGSHSHNVTLCRTCLELRNPCEFGKCLDAPTQRGFVCVCSGDDRTSGTCPASCSGSGCYSQFDLCKLMNPCNGFKHNCVSKLTSLECNCAPGYSGNTCERVNEYGFCSRGNGYIRIPSALFKRRIGVPEVIRMGFTLHRSSGQLLWQGDKVNHLSVAVVDGILEYVYLNQRSTLEVRSGSRLDTDQEHTLVIRKKNNTVTVEVSEANEPWGENALDVYKNATFRYNTNRVNGDIYLGNAPNGTRHFGHHVGLDGCIHYISFGDDAKVNLPEKALERFNVFASSSPRHKTGGGTNRRKNSSSSSYSDDSDYKDYSDDSSSGYSLS